MENEQLLQMLGFYKQALADATEEKFALQAMMQKQGKQIQELNEQVNNLKQQLDNINNR